MGWVNNNQQRAARALNVAIVPDSFKGSASAGNVAEAMAQGVRAAAQSCGREVQLGVMPFADGGEGTLDAILEAWGVPAREVQTTDAIGRTVAARYGISPDSRTAVIEAAEANGLPAVSDVPLQPLSATSYGVGTIISHALDAGVQRFVLCLGGSATTDGGTGLLRALGARFLDAGGRQLPDGGGSLGALAYVDLRGLDPRAQQARWQIACDVTNPLLGPRGAAAVFGPQKGAGPEEVLVLERGLRQLAQVLARQTGTELAEVPGMGAAGGLAACLAASCEVELVPGWELVAEVLGIRELLAHADLLLTGEGRLDSQSLSGKVVNGVRLASPEHTDVIVIAGSVQLTEQQLAEAGLLAAHSIAAGPASLAELSQNAPELIRRTTFNVLRTYLAAR